MTLSVAQAAAKLAMSEYTVRCLIRDGDLSAERGGGRMGWQIDPASVQALAGYTTVAQAAAQFGISTESIYQRIRDRRLSVRSLNSRWYVQKYEIKKWQKERAK